MRYLKHWENARTGHVMCLVEAPDADALRRARGELQAVVVKEVTDLLPPPSGTRTVREGGIPRSGESSRWPVRGERPRTP
ncbi:MAG: hypothetical protein ACRDH6_07430 [Actinomycetota bacterium]